MSFPHAITEGGFIRKILWLKLTLLFIASELSGCFSSSEPETIGNQIRHGVYEHEDRQKVPCVPNLDGNTDSSALKSRFLFQDYGEILYHSSLNDQDLCMGRGFWHQYTRKVPDSIQSIKRLLQLSELSISCRTLDSLSAPHGGYSIKKRFDFIEYEISSASDSKVEISRLYSSSDSSSDILFISQLESHLNMNILEDCGYIIVRKIPTVLEKVPFDQGKWEEIEALTYSKP